MHELLADGDGPEWSADARGRRGRAYTIGMETAPPSGSTLCAPPTPADYEVDARGHRVESRAATAPGADLVRLSSVLDLAALAAFCTHLVLTVEGVSMLILLVGLAVVPLVLLYTSCASGMEDMTLRIRRILGMLIPALVIATVAARGRMEDFLGGSIFVRLPLLTMPFGAFTAHRALVLTVRARERATSARCVTRTRSRRVRGIGVGSPEASPYTAEPSGVGPSPAAVRSRSALGAIVLASGFVLLASGAIEALHRVWWFGLVFMAAGGLCVARSRDIGGPSSDRRLRRTDRDNVAVWVYAPVGALVAAGRAIWVLTVGS